MKLKVLHTCVKFALLYSCETCGPSSIVELETIHYNAIMIAFTLRTATHQTLHAATQGVF